MAGTPPFWSALLTRASAVDCKATSLVQFEVFLTYNGASGPQPLEVLRNIFGEVKEDKRGGRELPHGNDRLTKRSLTQRLPKR